MKKALDRKLYGLWQRMICSQPSSNILHHVSDWARDKDIPIVDIEQKQVGCFTYIDSIVIDMGSAKACLPLLRPTDDETWKAKSEDARVKASTWKKLEWFSPWWVPGEKVQELLTAAQHRSPAEALDLFSYHTSTMYNIPYQAVCITQIMTAAPCLKSIAPLAREAFLAFYAGYRASSIAALIPAIEGAFRKISNLSSDASIRERVNFAVDKAISYAADLHFEGMWVPSDFRNADYLFGVDERVFAFETYRRWLLDSFFEDTKFYSGASWLNRHCFAHGTSNEWQDTSNLTRLIVALSTLGLVEAWSKRINTVSVLFPSMNTDAELLWQQALLRANHQLAINLLEENKFHATGRLVPEMPTDKGELLRKAILNEDCINDLVRPLRNAGWSIDFVESIHTDLYIRLIAKYKKKSLRISLLYSCATDNKIYLELDKLSDVILYRGAPYEQSQYARNVKAHVGPVTGWQPPDASDTLPTMQMQNE